jgi:hypothetical protein
MADASRLKRGLGTPPAPDEARTDLMPEPTAAGGPTPRPVAGAGPTQRIDARSLRRSGRTVHFATKVTPAGLRQPRAADRRGHRKDAHRDS